MIKLNLKNAVTKESVNKYKDVVKKAAIDMENLKSVGAEYLG